MSLMLYLRPPLLFRGGGFSIPSVGSDAVGAWRYVY